MKNEIKTEAALLAALKELVYRFDIRNKYEQEGRLETRWTDKDGIAEPGSLANHDAETKAIGQARAAIAQAEKGAA